MAMKFLVILIAVVVLQSTDLSAGQIALPSPISDIVAYLLHLAATGPSISNVKLPGQCPTVPPGTYGACGERCQAGNDNSCPNLLKCCFNGCGHVCEQSYVVQEQLSCPSPPTLDGQCSSSGGSPSCSSDSQCSTGELCCPTSCNYNQCQIGVKQEVAVRQGYCPTTIPSTTPCDPATAVDKCKTYADCPSQTMTCCRNTTCDGTSCVEIAHVGACAPLIGSCSSSTDPPAGTPCTSDIGCTGFDKCCNRCPGPAMQCTHIADGPPRVFNP